MFKLRNLKRILTPKEQASLNRSIAQKRRFSHLSEEQVEQMSLQASEAAKKRHKNMNLKDKKAMYAKTSRTQKNLYKYCLAYRETLCYIKYLNTLYWDNISKEDLLKHKKACSDAQKRLLKAGLHGNGKSFKNFKDYHEVELPRKKNYCGVVTKKELVDA